jgi:RND superfamily putative drug exporter
MQSDPSPGSIFYRLGGWLARHAWLVFGVCSVLLALAGWYGSSVSQHLSVAGLEAPGSESHRAMLEAARRFGFGSADVLLLYRNEEGRVLEAGFGSLVIDALDPVLGDPGVLGVTTVYDSGQEKLVARDGREMLAVLSLAGDAEQKLETYRRIEPMLRAVEPPVDLQIGGLVPFTVLVQEIAREDAIAAELWALPIALLLALWFFRSPLAALLPIGIGAISLAGSAALTRAASNFTDVSIFAMNVGAFLGLGLSIDYALLLAQRFREELTRTSRVEEAVAATYDTAGRAVWISGLTVALSLAALIPVPLPLLHSVSIGGVLVVASALGGALVLLPALLAIVGRNIDRWSLGPAIVQAGPSPFWRWIGELSMRHPVPSALGCVGVLLILASPALRFQSAMPDARALPAGSEVRRVDETLADPERFDPSVASTIPVIVETKGAALDPAQLRELRAFAEHLRSVPGIATVRSPFDRLDPDRLGPDELEREQAREPTSSLLRHMVDGNVSLLIAENRSPWRSQEASAAVTAIRAVPRGGLQVAVGGATAQMVDLVQTLREYAPIALVLVAGWNFLILFSAFESVAVPIKAVLMNLLSMGASYGVLVWVFQDGHFSGWLGFEPLDGIDPTIPLIMFAIVFGLSMDYEVFLLSRIREEWLQSGDNARSVVEGIARTGRTITSAALILLVVIGAFVAGDLLYVKQIGLGISAAVAIDVTIVRALLVPATMQMLGRWNWWTPRWLRPSLAHQGRMSARPGPPAGPILPP